MSTKKQFTVNVGLFVDGKAKDGQLEKVINFFKPFGTGANYLYYRVDNGQYEGQSEPTAILCISIEPHKIHGLIETACDVLRQECIPYAHEHENINGLVYNTAFTGKKESFNSEYFLPLCQTANRLHM